MRASLLVSQCYFCFPASIGALLFSGVAHVCVWSDLWLCLVHFWPHLTTAHLIRYVRPTPSSLSPKLPVVVRNCKSWTEILVKTCDGRGSRVDWGRESANATVTATSRKDQKEHCQFQQEETLTRMTNLRSQMELVPTNNYLRFTESPLAHSQALHCRLTAAHILFLRTQTY